MPGVVGGAHADEENLTHEGRDRSHERLHVGRELFAGRLQPFLHEHTRIIDVGVPIELGVDEGQCDVGIGAQTGEPVDPEQGAFEGLGDPSFHLFGSEAGRFREDDHRGFGEVGQHLDRQAKPGVEAPRQQHHRQAEHDGAVGE